MIIWVLWEQFTFEIFRAFFYGGRRGIAKKRIMIPFFFSKCDPGPSVLIASNLAFGIEITLNAIIIFFQTKRRR